MASRDGQWHIPLFIVNPMKSYYLDTTFRQPYQSRRWQFCAIASVLVVLLLSLDWLDSRSLLVSHAQSAYFKVSSTRHVKFYIYELPDAMSKDVWSNPTKASWLTTTSEYDGDVWVYHALANSPFRTYDPDEASLFYIPIFPTQYKYQLAGGNYSWREVETRTTQQVREAISLISSQYPHWNRTKGRDHFLTITGDEGRCAAFRGMKADEFGEMFVIQHHGDLVAFHKWMPHYGDSSSTITQEDAWPCYRPDRDIILPTYLPEKDVPPHPVRGTSSRNTSVLYSFQAGGFASQKAFRNVRVRNELRRYYEMDPPLDSAWPSKRNISETIDDMARSVFCATPPGLVAHTSRFYRAIQRGCIPIHFMSAYDLPFQSQIDYDSFTLRLHPHNIGELSSQVATLLKDEDRLARMQSNLQQVQDRFNWELTPGKLGGVDELLHSELDHAHQRVLKVM